METNLNIMENVLILEHLSRLLARKQEYFLTASSNAQSVRDLTYSEIGLNKKGNSPWWHPSPEVDRKKFIHIA